MPCFSALYGPNACMRSMLRDLLAVKKQLTNGKIVEDFIFSEGDPARFDVVSLMLKVRIGRRGANVILESALFSPIQYILVQCAGRCRVCFSRMKLLNNYAASLMQK